MRLVSSIFLIAVAFNVNAQNISKHYTASLQNNGTLYFIYAQNGFEHQQIKSRLSYDITYLTTNDTAVLTYSYFDKSTLDIDSISFTGGGEVYTSSAKKIFIETKKEKWHYRYSSRLLFTDLNNFFDQAKNPKIILYTKQGLIELTIKTKAWKKQSYVTKKILTLIKYNR